MVEGAFDIEKDNGGFLFLYFIPFVKVGEEYNLAVSTADLFLLPPIWES
jgi:hypothetical protein